MGLLNDILGGVASFLDIGANYDAVKYNKEANQRDFDYQKALQQQIFEREDTAVQRRAADLEAAGLNPNLAAGSAASAGSVVSRSNTNDLNIGSFADTIGALNQIKMQNQQTQNLKKEGEILETKKNMENFNAQMSIYETLSALGFDVKPEYYQTYDKKGNLNGHFAINHTTNRLDSLGRAYTAQPYRNMVIGNMNNAYDAQRLQSELLQKDYDWYTADKVSGMILGGLGVALPKFSYKIK